MENPAQCVLRSEYMRGDNVFSRDDNVPTSWLPLFIFQRKRTCRHTLYRVVRDFSIRIAMSSRSRFSERFYQPALVQRVKSPRMCCIIRIKNVQPWTVVSEFPFG